MMQQYEFKTITVARSELEAALRDNAKDEWRVASITPELIENNSLSSTSRVLEVLVVFEKLNTPTGGSTTTSAPLSDEAKRILGA